MGQLAIKHRKNRGARYERRKALQALGHYGNQSSEQGARCIVDRVKRCLAIIP